MRDLTTIIPLVHGYLDNAMLTLPILINTSNPLSISDYDEDVSEQTCNLLNSLTRIERHTIANEYMSKLLDELDLGEIDDNLASDDSYILQWMRENTKQFNKFFNGLVGRLLLRLWIDRVRLNKVSIFMDEYNIDPGKARYRYPTQEFGKGFTYIYLKVLDKEYVDILCSEFNTTKNAINNAFTKLKTRGIIRLVKRRGRLPSIFAIGFFGSYRDSNGTAQPKLCRFALKSNSDAFWNNSK